MRGGQITQTQHKHKHQQNEAKFLFKIEQAQKLCEESELENLEEHRRWRDGAQKVARSKNAKSDCVFVDARVFSSSFFRGFLGEEKEKKEKKRGNNIP